MTRLSTNIGRCIVAACLCTTQFRSACGQEIDGAGTRHASPVPPAELYRPTASPDRIVLSWTDNPATSQAVTWRTSADVVEAYARVAAATDGPSFAEEPTTVVAETERLDSDLGSAHYHSVTFRGLRPVTTYAYQVGDGVNWSEWCHFTTAADSDEPFSFIYFGDAQNKIKSHCSRVLRQAFRTAPDAAFALHAGDLVGWGDSDAHWAEWHYAMSHFNRSVPCIATPGNHEYFYRNDEGVRVDEKRLSTHWRAGFAFPLNGPPGLEEAVYWVDYQGVRVVALDSNTRRKEQAEWLDGVLSDNPNRWTVVTFHHPAYSARVGRDNSELRKMWQPVFDKHNVDLVLQGHDHCYARSRRLSGGIRVALQRESDGSDGKRGAVYIVSVAGPKMYEIERKPFMEIAAEGVQLYQVVRVRDDRIRYEAYTATGRLYDAFTLQRDGQGDTRVVEQTQPPAARSTERVASASAKE